MFPGNWHGSRINKHCRQRAWNWLEIEFFGVGATRVCRTSALWISKVDTVGKMQPYFGMRNIRNILWLTSFFFPSPKCSNLMIRSSTVWYSFWGFFYINPSKHQSDITFSFSGGIEASTKHGLWRQEDGGDGGFWWRDASFLVWCVVEPCFIKKNEGWH